MYRKKELISFVLVCSILFMAMNVNALSCTSQTFSNSYEIGSIPSSDISISHCSNSGNLTNISLSGEGTSYISLASGSSSINTNNEKDIRINIDQNIPVGNYLLSASFSDGSSPITISISITQTPSSSCSINIFPTTLTNVKITQGEKKTRSITLSVPTCFPSTVTVQGISLQTDQKPIQLGELSVGDLQPGQSINIPVELDGTDISIGQYTDVLQYLLYNSSGNVISVPNTNIGVLVSQGVAPISNFSISELPSCSLNANTLNINQTYSFVCSISNPNIKIEPIFDTGFLVGVSDTSTSTQYIYNFKAKKLGTTSFTANFYYEGSSGKSLIGNPYNQSLKITNTGSALISGTTLNLIFYQDGIKKTRDSLQAKETIIQAVDNTSGNLVEGYSIQVGGVLLSNATLNIEADKTYDLRITAPGFDDLVTNLTASKISVPFTISPTQDTYSVGDILTLNSSVNGTIYLINDQIILSPYTLNSEGTFTIIARNPNYIDNEKNFTVKKSIFSLTGAVTWQKGEKVKFELNKASSWDVYFSDGENPSEIINSGVGTEVSFKITKAGTYEVVADGVMVDRQVITNPDKKFSDWVIGLFVLGGLILIIFIVSLFSKKNNKSDSIDDIVGVN